MLAVAPCANDVHRWFIEHHWGGVLEHGSHHPGQLVGRLALGAPGDEEGPDDHRINLGVEDLIEDRPGLVDRQVSLVHERLEHASGAAQAVEDLCVAQRHAAPSRRARWCVELLGRWLKVPCIRENLAFKAPTTSWRRGRVQIAAGP